MCHSDTLLHQKNVRFFCLYSSETGMHATSRNSVKSPKMMQGFFDVSSGQTIFHAAKKDSRSSFRHSFQLGLQGKFSAKVTSTKHLTESPLPPQCGSSCLVSWLLNSESLVLWGIEKYNNTITSLVVPWVNSSVRSQCEGQLARCLWGIARVMIETRVPQNKD